MIGGTGARKRTTAGRRFSPSVTLVEPVHIDADVVIEESTVGPNVSIEAGTVVHGSVVTNAIVGQNCRIEHCQLDGAMLGDDVVVTGLRGSAALGSHSEVRAG